jgi:crossover junction endodeoxyribonuclease RuvC
MGVDPGTICCGYGIVDTNNRPSSHPVYISSGEIRMNKKDALPARLKILFYSLKTTIDTYKPSQLCIEKIFYHKSIPSAFALGSTRGVAMLLAAENSMPVFEYNATERTEDGIDRIWESGKKAGQGYGVTDIKPFIIRHFYDRR